MASPCTKQKGADAFLDAHPGVHWHFMPYAFWLKQVGLWIGKIEGDLLARGPSRRATVSRAKTCQHM